MSELLEPRSIGMSLARLDGYAKVTGTAPYAFEHPVADPLYLHPLQATIARGRVTVIDTTAAETLEGVVAVITHNNAPRLASDENKELWVLQSDEVHFGGQFTECRCLRTCESRSRMPGSPNSSGWPRPELGF